MPTDLRSPGPGRAMPALASCMQRLAANQATTEMIIMANPSHREPGDTTQRQFAEPSAIEEVTDPICGMQLDPEDADTERTHHKGRTYYFCSADCREQFEASPDDFVDA